MSIFGGSAQRTTAETTPHETALNVQSSVAGKVVSVVLGTKRIPGNLVWYGDFTSIAHTSGGGGGGGKGGGGGSGGGSTSYTYTASVMLGLCVGEITGVSRVWTGDDASNLSGLGASVAVRTGARGQSAWPWLAASHPTEALNYSGLAYVGIATADLGASSHLPNWNWEVRGLGSAAATYDNDAFDIAFPEAVKLVVENTQWACGLTGIVGDLSDYGAWCRAHGLTMSDAYTEAKSAREIIQGYCRATLAEPVWDGDTLTVVPYADQDIIGPDGTVYSPDLAPALILTPSMLLPAQGDDEGPIRVRRRDTEDFFNYLTVEYHNRSNDYNPDTVTATDDAHIATHGQKPGSSVAAHFFHTAAMAQTSADLIQGREIGSPATYEFGLTPVGGIIRPMQIVWLNEPEQGFKNYPVRIKTIEEGDAFNFSVTAEEIPGCVGAMASRVIATTGQGYRSEANRSPANCNAPVIFEPPSVLTSGTGLEVWAAISGSTADWGGCEVWVSTDGDTYRRAGSVSGGARTGILTAEVGVADDPDTSNNFDISLAESRASLLSGTRADADIDNTLCYVGGELISYRDADLIGANTYRLGGYVRRGRHGTAIARHRAGEPFARLDGVIFRYPFTADMIGTTVYIKALGLNQRGGGLQSLSDVTAYPYTLTGSALASPLPNVGGISVGYVGGISQMSWSAVSDFRNPDYEIRLGTSANTAQIVGRTSNTSIPTYGDGTYWIGAHYRMSDGRDVYSEEWSRVIVTVAQLSSNVIAGFSEAEMGWSGAHDGTYLRNGVIELQPAGNILAAANVLTIPSVLSYGGIRESGIYTVPEGRIIDAGRIATCSVAMSVAVHGRSLTDNILAAANVLSVTDILGAGLGPSVTAVPQIRLSQDGVVWDDWQDWFPAQYTARAIWPRLVARTSDDGITPVVAEFVYRVDVPDRTDHFVIEVPEAGIRISYADGLQGNPAADFNGGPAGHETPVIQASIVRGAQSGDGIIISNDSTSGFTVSVVNGGVAVSGRTVSINCQGY